MKIEKLTTEQEEKIEEYRERYFRQATSTEPADRSRAEKAARRMAEIGGVKVNKVVWVDMPEEARKEYQAVLASLMASLRNILRDGLSASLSANLWASLSTSLRDGLSARLSARLRDRLSARLRDGFMDGFMDSLMDSLWDMGWLCLYGYAVGVLGVECSKEHCELLDLHNEIASSCFALWIVPGKIILCERPKSVKIVDGQLVGLTWREQ